MRFSRLEAAACCLLLPLTCAAQSYHVSDHWQIGGEGGWDYLLSDDAAHRLYVTHGPKVEVLDTASGKLIGSITGLKGTHGVALNPDGKTGYISDGGGNAIVVFDRASLNVVNKITVGTNPDGITYEPATKTVWAFNGRSKNVSVMSATNNQVVATIALPGKPEFPQADGDGYVYVNIEDKNEIVKLDAKTNAVVGTWPLTGCDSPSGMAIDRIQHRLFSVCDGKKMGVSNYTAGKLVALASIGDGPDAAGFDGKLHLAFSSNGEGTISIVNTSKPGYPTVQTVTTVKGARTMAYDALTGRIFLSAAKYGPPPAATATTARPRPAVVPGSFEIMVVSH